VLDREKLGMDVVVFVMIGLVSQTGKSLQEFETRMHRLPEVLECYTITGQTDYMLKVITRDMRHYEKFMRNQLAQVPNIREMHSHVAVTKIKDTMELPLDSQLI
jgi:Lrp/AsnC family transcriptional regulator